MDELKGIILAVVGSIVLVVGIWVFASFMEARAFNRITGNHVSTWDAMFVELRVMDTGEQTQTRDKD